MNQAIKILCLLLLCFFVSASPARAITFSSGTSYSANGDAGHLTSGDFNNDGYPDLVKANYYNRSSISLFINNQDGTFANAVNLFTGLYPAHIAVDDFNQDGNSDIAVFHHQIGHMSVLLNKGDGTFDDNTVISNFYSEYPYPLNYYLDDMHSGDINNDGYPDLIADGMFVFINLQDGTFDLVKEYFVWPAAGLVGSALIDVNNDSFLDISILGENGNIGFFQNNGDGTFTEGLVPYPVGITPSGISSSDFNSDTFMDLAVTHTGGISVLLNNQDGTFGPAASYTTSGNPKVMATGDFDSNGTNDIVAVSQTGTTILSNDGSGAFDIKQKFSVFGRWGVVARDFDGDGDVDLAVSGTGNIQVYLNISLASDGIASWLPQVVDDPKSFDSSAIAADLFGNPHFAYGGDHLYHAYFDGSVWRHETVDPEAGVGSLASIAVDSNNRVHISYVDNLNGRLKYATNESGSWVIRVIEGNLGWYGGYSSLILDSRDKAHIGYLKMGPSSTTYLKYATNADGVWRTGFAERGTVNSFSMAVDSAGRAHVVYPFGYPGELRYASNTSGTWQFEIVDTSISIGSRVGLALDSNDNAHITYHYQDSLTSASDLIYVTNSSGTWQLVKTISSGNYPGSYYSSDLTIDSSGYIHVIYEYTDTIIGVEDIRHDTNASGTWQSEVVSNSKMPWFSAVVDDNGAVHAGSFDPVRQNLLYHTNASGTWIMDGIVDVRESVGKHTSIGTGSDGVTHIAYFGETNSNLKYATDVSGSWVTEILDTGLGVYPADNSISLGVDSNNHVHISYWDGINNDLKYASNQSGVWTVETLDTGGYVGKFSSLGIDPDNNIHISYFDETNGTLKYLMKSGGTLAFHIVDSYIAYHHVSSIAADSGNNAHISYYDGTNYNLKYATNSSGTWVSTIADSSSISTSYPNTSIAVDSSGKIHITHQSGNDLKYSSNTSGIWKSEVVDSAPRYGNYGSFNSLGLDSNDKAHISYLQWQAGLPNGFLKYATNRLGVWSFEVVDDTGSVGKYNSIEIDSGDNIYISYSDSINRSLKYAGKLTPRRNDSVPPESIIGCAPVSNTAGWNNTGVNCTITSVDDPGGTGVREVRYQTGPGGVNIVPGATASFMITAEGVTTVTYYTVDNAGNIEIPKKTSSVSIDDTPPLSSIACLPLPAANGWNTRDVTCNITGVDGGAGVSEVHYQVRGGTPLPEKVVTGSSASFSIPADGVYNISYFSVDKAGNTERPSKTHAVRLDRFSPVVTAPADITVAATGLLTPVDLVIPVVRDAVGVVSITSDAPASFPFGLTTVTWTAVDKAGNRGTATQRVTVTDPTEISLSKAEVEWGKESFKLHGSIVLPGWITPSELTPSGSGEIALSTLGTLFNQNVNFTVKGAAGSKWEYESNTGSAGIEKFKINWKGSKFDYNREIRIKSNHIGAKTVTLEIEKKSLPGAVIITIGTCQIHIDETGGVAVFPENSLIVDVDVDDDGEIELELPFALSTATLVRIEPAGHAGYDISVSDYLTAAEGKFEIKGRFSPAGLTGDVRPANLDLRLSTGGTLSSSIAVKQSDWQQLKTNEWKFKSTNY